MTHVGIDIAKHASSLYLFGKEKRRSVAEAGISPSYRWAILFCTWMAFLLSYIDRVAWSSVAAPVGQSLGLSVNLLGAFVTAFYVGYVIANVAGGLVTDTIGPRLTLSFALIPLGVATFAFGNTHSLTMGIALQIVMGLTAGADYAAGMKIIASWFSRERGLAMGFYGTATSLAVVISNATVPALSLKYGWGIAFHILGISTCVWGVICLLMLRDSPQKCKPVPITWIEVRALIRNRNLVLISLAGCCGFWATVGFGAWGSTLMVKEYGFSAVKAGSILAVFGLGAIIAKPSLGLLRDILGTKSAKIMPIGCLLCFSALLIIFGQCSTDKFFYIVAPFLGAAAFGYTPLLYVLITEASGTRSSGTASGLINAIWQLGAGLAPMVIGAVYASSHSFPISLYTLAIGPAIGAALLALTTPMHGDAAA